MKANIICIGNRFVESDAAGLQVLAALQKMRHLPPEITITEGGLAGLNLLPLLEQGGRVVFIDAVRGFTGQGQIVLLGSQEIMQSLDTYHFDHAAGLAYLLTVLPQVCDGELPEEIALVGLEGTCSSQTIERAASLSVAISCHGMQDIR